MELGGGKIFICADIFLLGLSLYPRSEAGSLSLNSILFNDPNVNVVTTTLPEPPEPEPKPESLYS